MKLNLPVLNVHEVTYECTFGRGCDGVCCQQGRPPVTTEEKQRLDDNIAKFLPHLRPAARRSVERDGYLSRRIKSGKPMMRVVEGWCVFFNQGCVLHKVGAAEGDKYRYKPAPCSLFPLESDDDDRWYVRQHGYQGEKWDLFCLAPGHSNVPASESLKEELALARRLTLASRTAASK
jgi:Fe-S-cluster containining protein